jgi:bifunctional non-homologous end joining protein LigD
MALERYRQKRNFSITPEPDGRVGTRPGPARSFVVQKHAASRLHFDFRLEHEGVLLSWAVPKGPSLDPNDKRLAMHVEDHPLAYGDFEGVIPPKQYGAGTVMVWDRGTWQPIGDAAASYAKGRLKFELHGEKLRGVWNLVRSRGGNYGGDASWLLFKEADDHARLGAEAQVDDVHPLSVLTGRDLTTIAAQKDRVWHSNRSAGEQPEARVTTPAPRKRTAALAKLPGAKRAPLPDKVEPQLATLAKHPPAGANWVHEIKHDGYRMLARIEDGRARLMSRSGKDWTREFASLVDALGRLPVESAWIDGEAVVLDADGKSSFQALQNALDGRGSPALAYFAFDLLHLDGIDLTGVALTARKRVLQELLDAAPPSLRYSEHFDAPGAAFLQNVAALGLEGMVSKRADRPYTAGRGPSWQKVKCPRRETFVVGGWTDPEGSRGHFGALLLGSPHDDGTIDYRGRVGSGFDDRTLASIARSLAPLASATAPFRNPPTGVDARGMHWVKPVLMAEVTYTERTDDGTLRQPVFVGMKAAQARNAREKAPASKHAIAGIELSNPDKLLYPEAKLSKRDLARYYESVGQWMLREIAGRPLTLVRHPNGWDQKGFYQKNADDGVAAAASRVVVDADGTKYYMAETVAALVALLQLGALEIHPWGSRVPNLGRPDRIVLDLDPDEGLAWDDVRQAALLVRSLVENLGLAAFLKTTGGKGLHVVVPLEPAAPWKHVKGFTKAIAELLERTFRDRFTSKLLKVSRGGRVFIDYLRNAEGATAVAAYSLRAKANAPVSTPIAWEELDGDVRFDHFHARNVPARLAALAADPWGDIDAAAKRLTPALAARVGYAMK